MRFHAFKHNFHLYVYKYPDTAEARDASDGMFRTLHMAAPTDHQYKQPVSAVSIIEINVERLIESGTHNCHAREKSRFGRHRREHLSE